MRLFQRYDPQNAVVDSCPETDVTRGDHRRLKIPSREALRAKTAGFGTAHHLRQRSRGQVLRHHNVLAYYENCSSGTHSHAADI